MLSSAGKRGEKLRGMRGGVLFEGGLELREPRGQRVLEVLGDSRLSGADRVRLHVFVQEGEEKCGGWRCTVVVFRLSFKEMSE